MKTKEDNWKRNRKVDVNKRVPEAERKRIAKFIANKETKKKDCKKGEQQGKKKRKHQLKKGRNIENEIIRGREERRNKEKDNTKLRRSEKRIQQIWKSKEKEKQEDKRTNG